VGEGEAGLNVFGRVEGLGVPLAVFGAAFLLDAASSIAVDKAEKNGN
jgi:hypothetical protein